MQPARLARSQSNRFAQLPFRQVAPALPRMTKSSSNQTETSKEVADGSHYVVVARRYRPQTFGELIGQNQVSQALQNAILTNRVGHAYLFTGARGVGKTSAARILAKTLNCTEGSDAVPCQKCDICQSIAAGSDMDVIEIDGASNRGIDEIRQLRSSVGVRPSRARFKVYIIDEVHMLTKEAFNALLKTLEEPPEHVKFVFCTTDPERIPITVLSRCQRFDFAPIGTEAIADRLEEIVAAEGATADREALELLARKAAGSMRDSQSLLEQLLSFAADHITVDMIQSMLGTASLQSVTEMVSALAQRDAATALHLLDQAICRGIDVGQFAEQILGYLRDVLATGVGCDARLLQVAPVSDREKLHEFAMHWGVAGVLNVIQLLDQAIVRMRQVLHRRTLVELALVRICELENLTRIAELAAALGQSYGATTTAPREKKTDDVAAPPSQTLGRSSMPSVTPTASACKTNFPATESPPAAEAQGAQAATSDEQASLPLTSENLESLWLKALNRLRPTDIELGKQFINIELRGRQLTVRFDAPLNVMRFQEESRAQSLRNALRELTGTDLQLCVVQEEAETAEPVSRKQAEWELRRESVEHPLVQAAIQLFDGDVTKIQAPPNGESPTGQSAGTTR